MFISNEFLNKLRDRVDISDVVSRRVKLTKKGKEYSGLCPFHNERSPSFTVNDLKQFYHCFGCGAHGDIVKFTMEAMKMEFIEAVKFLADDAKIPLPVSDEKIIKQNSKLDDLYNINSIASEWFKKQLNLSGEALNYLKSRGVCQKTIKEFNLGYAPKGSGLKNYLQTCKISLELMHEAGLISKGDNNEYWDKFRGRIIFPIFNKSNNVIAFGGRSLGSEMPKYLNSPETEIFKKSEVLYNLNKASLSSNKSDQIIVVEGYMDVIAMHMAGFDKTVACLGTAMGESHIIKLWKIVPEPIICLDGDNAGLNAMRRITELVIPLVRPGYSLKFITLPEDSDPDDFIKNNGRESMDNLIQNAIPLSEFIWQNQYETFGQEITPEQKSHFEKNLSDITSKITDKNVRNNYRDYFKKKIWESFTKTKFKFTKKNIQTSNNISIKQISARERSEGILFSIILNYPTLIYDGLIEEEFTYLELSNDNLEKLKIAILDTVNKFQDEKLELNKENFRSKLNLSLEKLELSNNYNYLYNNESIILHKDRDMDYVKSLWLCNISRYRINILIEEKQQALNLLTEKSMEKANILQEQINELEKFIASLLENML